MSLSRPELIALCLVASLGLSLGLGQAKAKALANININSDVTNAEQQMELKLSALRVHRQLLQAEIARVYMDAFTAETPMLLQELQQRQQDIQQQIETLESKTHAKDAEQLAHSLANDFGILQRKLNELKQQLDASNVNNASNSKQLAETQRDGSSSSSSSSSTPRTPIAAVSSYFWSPLLTMPDYSSGSIAPPAQTSPSLIRRVLAMLRPSTAAATTADRWPEADAGKSQTKLQLLSAEELLPQLQLQRQFLDEAIKRLELLANNNNNNNKRSENKL